MYIYMYIVKIHNGPGTSMLLDQYAGLRRPSIARRLIAPSGPFPPLDPRPSSANSFRFRPAFSSVSERIVERS